MYNWLRSYKTGDGQSFNMPAEKKELIELRKEIKRLNKMNKQLQKDLSLSRSREKSIEDNILENSRFDKNNKN